MKKRTQAWREQLGVEVCEELLRLGVEHALAGDDVAGQADADDLEDGAEDEDDEMAKVGMRRVGRQRAGAGGVGGHVERGHGGEVGSIANWKVEAGVGGARKTEGGKGEGARRVGHGCVCQRAR